MATQSRQTEQQQRAIVQPNPAARASVHARTASVAPQPDPQDVHSTVAAPRQASPAHLLEIQRRYGNRAVQRMLNGSVPAAKQQLHDPLPQIISRAGLPGSPQGGVIDAQAQGQIERARGGGSPLDARVGAQVGGALGVDFNGVKVHTDSKADILNRALSAKAFTTGRDIFFSRGAYEPRTSSGKQLLAHELTHVVQQGSAKPNKTSPERNHSVQTKRLPAGQAKPLLSPAPTAKIQREWWNPRSWGKKRAVSTPPSGLQTTPGYTPSDDAEEQAVAEAFRTETFYYGTTGGNSKLKEFIKRIHKPKLERAYEQAKAVTPPKEPKEEAGLKSRIEGNMYYWPGERAGAYLEGRSMGGKPGSNMMDNYYGNENLQMHKLRNPAIGKYVHKAMGYAGEYDQNVPGETAYKSTYGPTAGWDPKGKLFNAQPAPQVVSNWRGKRSLAQPGGVKTYRSWAGQWTGISGTMEISRQIRNGVQKYGGKIIFEGSTVPWNGSFVPGLIQGDTNVEAEYMMPYFALHPGQRTVPFGKGKMTFHWKGKPTVPSRELFRTKWNFDDSKNPAQENKRKRKVGDDTVASSNLYWKFPELGYDAKPRASPR